MRASAAGKIADPSSAASLENNWIVSAIGTRMARMADRLDDDLQAQFARDVAVLSKGGEEILETGRLERRQDVFFEDSDESSKRVCANL